MQLTEFKLDDIVQMKKKHPCGTNRWKIIRLGADIRIKCIGCNHSVLIPKKAFQKKVKSVENKAPEMKNDVPSTKVSSPPFQWPSLNVGESDQQSKSDIAYKEQSNLNILGYRITGLNREQRWIILTKKAIPQLGLKEVVITISSHIRNRKRQVDGSAKFRYAIGEWEHDLMRLKQEYYKGTFKWPNEA
jgi:hypothetical protein